ncbi:MAG: hypothetical protein GY772_09320 [bacterium]|nr:hypothetical protein [bacterium]MCP4447148.1 hypothetical protein [Myxococcales bacterium]
MAAKSKREDRPGIVDQDAVYDRLERLEEAINALYDVSFANETREALEARKYEANKRSLAALKKRKARQAEREARHQAALAKIAEYERQRKEKGK